MSRWVSTVFSDAQNGFDHMNKTTFGTHANDLYDSGILRSQKSIIDNAKANSIIN